MKFIDKIKDLFSDEEEVVETKEIDLGEEEEVTEEKQEHKLPTFMRNKIEEEAKREEERRKREEVTEEKPISDREIARTRRENNFSFPMDMEDEPTLDNSSLYSSQNVLKRETKVADLYSKKEEPKPKKFKPTPVISPVYGILDKNYTKDDVKVQDEKSYEIQRPSRKVDFETVRNKAFGSLTDDIRNNLCENCELYQEVKITKAHELKLRNKLNDNLLNEMTEEEDKKEDVSLGDAEDNYFDFGVSYEAPKHSPKEDEELGDIKIVNHNDEDSIAEKIEVKELPPKEEGEEDDDLRKITVDEESADAILESLNEDNDDKNDIFGLIDSVYDEEEK